MFPWDDFNAREAATWDFCKKFWALSPDEQLECMQKSDVAKKLFAGNWFYLQEGDNEDPPLLAIPTKTEFRVSKSDDLPGADDLVVLQVPRAGATLPPRPRLTVPIEEVFRCTWFPYLTHRMTLGPRLRQPSKKSNAKAGRRKKATSAKARKRRDH